MTEAQIKHMVDRFLGWKLPESFNPDGGIIFKKTHSEQGPFGPQKYEPTGTNVFDAEQATAMVRHMIEGLPEGKVESPDWSPRASARFLPDGYEQRGSTGQLWRVSGERWVRVRGNDL